MAQKENGRREAPAEVLSYPSPYSDRGKFSTTCSGCGIGFQALYRWHKLCGTCFNWLLGSRHLRAAHDFLARVS